MMGYLIAFIVGLTIMTVGMITAKSAEDDGGIGQAVWGVLVALVGLGIIVVDVGVWLFNFFQ